MMFRKLLCIFTVAGALIPGQSVQAQQWPDKAIRLYVAQGPGGGQDTIARYLAEHVSQVLKQQILNENRPGAGAIIGMQAAARAPADGYNFAMTSSAGMASNPHLVKALSYDPLKDFVPVSMVSKPGFLISIGGQSTIKSLAELVAAEKASPGKFSVVIDGPRNATGLTAAYLNKVAGTSIRLVPYTSPAQGLQDVMTGNVDLFVQAVGLQLSHIEAGKLRPLAVSGVSREPSLPNVPTVGETFPGFALVGWLMISAPTGTPRPALEGLNRAFDTVLKNPEVQAWMSRNGSHNSGGAGSLPDLEKFVHDEIDLWGKAVKAIGLEPQ